MSDDRRYTGFSMSPSFLPHSATSPVSLAFDSANFTVWMGEPPTLWQTPLAEVKNVTITVGRAISLSGTIGTTRYSFSARRTPEHDTLIDRVREIGSVRQPRISKVSLVVGIVVVMLVASIASLTNVLAGSTSSVTLPKGQPANALLGRINIQRSDLPGGWNSLSAGVIPYVIGPAGLVKPDTGQPAHTPSKLLKIYNAYKNNYESCMGVTSKTDRFVGAAGINPSFQINGASFVSSINGGEEIGSSIQYYALAKSVRDDIAQYSSPKFGPCISLLAAQSLYAGVDLTVKAANTPVVIATYVPVTVAHDFLSGGVATVQLSGQSHRFYLVTLFAAAGHKELYLDAWVANLAQARSTIDSAVSACLARLEGSTTSSA